MGSTYYIDFDALTVIRKDLNGERHDLNAGRTPCKSLADLSELIRDLCRKGELPYAVAGMLLRKL